jgi:hypothetical protein
MLEADFETLEKGMRTQDDSLRIGIRSGKLLILLPVVLAVSAEAAGTGLKISQIVVPNATATYAAAINAKNHVVGVYITGGITKGFEWLGGSNYKTIVFPHSNNFSRANGINDSGEIVGDFFGQDNWYHGYTDIGGKLTQYDLPGGLGNFSTSTFGVNANGDTAGAAGGGTLGANNEGWVNIGGTVTTFYGSGTSNTFVNAINASGEFVGQWYDTGNLSHGFSGVVSGGSAQITQITYPGATQTACVGINDSGEITGYYFDSSGFAHGFTYSGGVFTTSVLTGIAGVNKNGAYVGTYLGPGNIDYGYMASKVAFKPTTVKVPKAQSTSTWAVNNAGVLVGQYTNSKGVTHGMMMNGTTVTNIDDPKGLAGTTVCTGINKNNDIVGYYAPPANPTSAVGFYYSAGTFTDIPGPAGSTLSDATSINDSGQVIGYFVDSSNVAHGFLLSAVGGTYQQLDVPGATQSYGYGINNAGEVTLQWTDAAGEIEAALYNGSTYTPINLPGATNLYVHALNNNGDAVYSWLDAAGNFHGGLLSGGLYYLLDESGSTNTRGDGINDSGLIVGRYYPSGTTTYQGFKGVK